MNILSFNVLCRDWVSRVPLLNDLIRAEAPDVFGLQEAHADWMDAVCAAFPDYDYVGIGRNDGKRDGEFSAVFYQKDRFTLLDSGHFWLSETPDVPGKGWDAACIRICSWALLEDKTNGKRFAAMNTHLDHRGVEARRKGLEMIVARIGEMSPGAPLVLTGDFNVFPDDECLAGVNLMLHDARTDAPVTTDKPSFNGFGLMESKIIDYIYYRGFTSADEFKVVDATFAGKPYISDHYPIEAVLMF